MENEAQTGSRRKRSKLYNGLVNANIVLIAVVITVLAVEAGLRLYLPSPDRYYVWPPYLHKLFNPYPGVMVGVEGQSHFIINSEGIRGDEFSPDDDYRVLAIGGSTTICLFLDQTEAWPQLLQDMLNEAAGGRKIWVGNVGSSGRNTREHLLQMNYLLSQYQNIDAVILLIGANDLGLRLIRGDAYTSDYLASPDSRKRLMERAFAVLPDEQNSTNLYWYKQSAVWRLWGMYRQGLTQVKPEEIYIQDRAGEFYIKNRRLRKNASLRYDLPDLSVSLDEYSRNINGLLQIAAAHNIRIILMTQPSMYRYDLTQAEKDLLWWGAVASSNNSQFYAVEALTDGLEMYNRRLLELCEQKQADCIDLASILPKDRTIFYDAVHFNENGAKRVAETIAAYMLHSEPSYIKN